MILPFPKIFALGSKQTARLFKGEIEITEKLDGSQIAFGNINGNLIIRSKGCQIFPETVDKMFKIGVENIVSLYEEKKLQKEIVFYGEYLKGNKHNVLVYDHPPKGNIALYGIYDIKQDFYYTYDIVKDTAILLDLDVVPLLYSGAVSGLQGTEDPIKKFINKESYLGKSNIEGIVIKNYNEQLLIGGQVIPLLMGKYVSEDFKEIHQKEWKGEHTGKGRWEIYKSQFCSTARWHKAIQHLRDKSELNQEPKDIGKLMKEIHLDITEEERENIKEWLWNEFGKEVLKTATNGFAPWYKDYLLQNIEVKNE